MTALLATLKTPGQTFGLLREDGTVEPCLVVPGGGSLSEVISVVVPAVVAGSVDYVDVTMVGDLAAVPADAPVFGAPQVDLVAAGVGGAFVGCRAAAPGTIRCTFLGPLAGGAANFTFATVS